MLEKKVNESKQPTKILIVEDESIVAKNIQSRLKKLGYDVPEIASSGEEAIQKAAKIQPDLVLMDIVLKGNMDGINAAKEIYTRFNIPVIYLTAYSDDKTLQRAKVTEPFGYLLKPFEIRELRSAIEVALYKHKTERALKEKKEWFATTLKSIGDAVVVTDSKGAVVFMNPGAETLTGWKRKDALGRYVGEILNTQNGEKRNLIKNTLTKAIRDEVVVELENQTLRVHKDNAKVTVDMSFATIRDEKGKKDGVVVVLRKTASRRQGLRGGVDAEKLNSRLGNNRRGFSFTLAVASSSILVQEGIHKILESERDIEIISSVSNQVEIIPLVRQNKPDLLLVDTALPKLDVEHLLELIEQESVDTKVILLLHTPDERLIINSISLGVRGFVSEASNQEQFIQAVRAVSKGEIWAEVKLITKILTQLLPSQKGFKRLLAPELTNKEEEVVKLIAQGLSNKQIAKKLYVSERTVKAHLRNMFKKFGVSSRFQLAMRFQNLGVSNPET